VELSDGQITRQGFVQLNQMEAEDNDDDLWVTLSAMGYNNELVMDEVYLTIYLTHFISLLFIIIIVIIIII